MALAFRLSVVLGHCPSADAERAIAHLAAVGLPTRAAADADALAARMAHDKKGGSLILSRGVGRAFVGTAADVAGFLRRALA